MKKSLCVVAVAVPVVGGWLMNAYFNHHPERDSALPPVKAMPHHHRHHHG
jgi:hypothetical protein